MGSKQRGSKIKKSRLMLILNSRKITITKMAEDLGYNRKSMSRAINAEYMDNKTLDDIARYLNVSPAFFTGVYPLMRVKDEYKQGYEYAGEKIVFDNIDPSGYDVPSYGDFMNSKANRMNRNNWDGPYMDFLVRLGMAGMIKKAYDSDNRVYFGADFVRDNSDYLIPPIRNITIQTVMAAINKSADYMHWKSYDDMPDDYWIPDDFPEIYEVIEPAETEDSSDPDGDEDA